MRRLLSALLLAVLSGCGGPRSFVRSTEPRPVRLELPPGKDYDAAWDVVLARLGTDLKIASASKPEGRVETEWIRTTPKYRVRAQASFAPDRRSLTLEAPAEARAHAGYDRDLLNVLTRDLQDALGATPGQEEARVPAAPEVAKIRFRTGLSFWVPEIEGLVETELGSTNIDFADDLDYDRALFAKARFGLQFKPGIFVDGWFTGARLSGSADLKNDEVMEGVLFPAGSHIRSELEFQRGGVVAGYELRSQNWTLAPRLGLELGRTKLSVRGPSTSDSESFVDIAFTPGFQARVLSKSHIFAQFDLQGLLGTYVGFEAELGLGLEIQDRLRIDLGWHQLLIDDVYGPNTEYRASFGGPFLGINASF